MVSYIEKTRYLIKKRKKEKMELIEKVYEKSIQ